MNFSEFKRRLGADPNDQDPEFLRARDSSPEFRKAAAEAEAFEEQLSQALEVPAPPGLIEDLQAIAEGPVATTPRRRPWAFALAASLIVAAGAVGLIWNAGDSWDSVQDYVADHYRHDGSRLLAMADNGDAANLDSVLEEFDVELKAELSKIVGAVKVCPTPDGEGVHMVLNTQEGLVTVFYMPGIQVSDREMMRFDEMEAMLVQLESGSAAIIAPRHRQVASYYPLIRGSIVNITRRS